MLVYGVHILRMLRALCYGRVKFYRISQDTPDRFPVYIRRNRNVYCVYVCYMYRRRLYVMISI